MDIEELWEKALKTTEIIRNRIITIPSFTEAKVPYLFLAESSVNPGDTIVRRGEVLVEKPHLLLPPNTPQLKGFDGQDEKSLDKELLLNFLIVRGIRFPSLLYNNITHDLDVFEGPLAKAIKKYNRVLQDKEDVHTGLVTGLEDCWQFSILIFIGMAVSRSFGIDLKRLFNN